MTTGRVAGRAGEVHIEVGEYRARNVAGLVGGPAGTAGHRPPEVDDDLAFVIEMSGEPLGADNRAEVHEDRR